MPDKTDRTVLKLTNLNSVIDRFQHLREVGYDSLGNWTLGQTCRHLMLDIRCSMDGYPRWTYMFAPLRPIIRRVLLPKILNFKSPAGIRTASKFVPPDGLDDATEFDSYKEQIERFLAFDKSYWKHPGFGYNDRDNLERIYSAHAAHHLSFLVPHDNQ